MRALALAGIGLVIGLVGGLVGSEIIGIVGVVVFDREVGIRYLPVVLGVAFAAGLPLADRMLRRSAGGARR
jgi:Family of unknown function (DUF5957)